MGKPLKGKTIAVTRSRRQASSVVAELEARGALVIHIPTIRFVEPRDPRPLDTALAGWDGFHWVVFTSATTVEFVLNRKASTGSVDPGSVRIAAIGPATARALRDRGWQPDLSPTSATADALLQALFAVDHPKGRRFFIPRSQIGRETLERGLTAAGADVTVAVAYNTVPEDPSVAKDLMEAFDTGTLDAVTFTSPSTFHSLAAMMGQDALQALGRSAVIASIGPVTSEAIRSSGLEVTVEAKPHTAEGLVEALVRHFAGST